MSSIWDALLSPRTRQAMRDESNTCTYEGQLKQNANLSNIVMLSRKLFWKENYGAELDEEIHLTVEQVTEAENGIKQILETVKTNLEKSGKQDWMDYYRTEQLNAEEDLFELDDIKKRLAM